MHHLQQHFVDYAKNDNLGKISIWLLAHADAQGADCDLCEELAQLHSTAVDFPKTGRPAVIKNRAQLVGFVVVHRMVIEEQCQGFLSNCRAQSLSVTLASCCTNMISCT